MASITSARWSLGEILVATALLLSQVVGVRQAVAEPAAQADDDEAIFMDVRLMAADLVDELVYSWLTSAPLDGRIALVLADVTAPVGLDERFDVMVENRLYELIRQNPSVRVDLVHCAICTQFVTKSNPQGTVLSRGIDQPEVLAALQQQMPDKKALSLSFEAVGRELMLRAQIFALSAEQRILWAKTFSTSLSARRALRETSPLISLESAREIQQQILVGHDPIEAVTRIVIRNFNVAGGAALAATPLPFIEQSFEAVSLPKRQLRAAVDLGFTSISTSLQAWSVGGHMASLLLRDRPSLMTPDLYASFGFQYIRLRGPGAQPFAANQPDLATIMNPSSEPRASLVAWRLALESHIKHRLGMLVFLEDVPILKGNTFIDESKFLGIPYHAYGAGMVLRW